LAINERTSKETPVLYRILVSTLVVAFSVAHADAATIDLDSADQSDFFDGILNAGDVASDDGLTIVFSSVFGSDGLSGSYIGSNGIYLSNDTRTFDAVSFEMSFSVNTILTAYDIDRERTRNGAFSISGRSGASGLNALGRTGRFAFDMGTLAYFAAGETYTLTHSGLGRRGFAAIDEFDFTIVESALAAVPLPPTAPLALVGLWAMRRVSRTKPSS
jgi:hypothetical protein